MSLNNIAALNIKSADYCCINSRISKSEGIILMQNFDNLQKKAESFIR